jgi:hypothetical protein
MSQLNYSLEQNEAFAGMKVDSRFDIVESHLAEGVIDFGLGVMSGNEDAHRQVRKPSKTKSVLSIDADLITANSTVVTINGVAETAVVFATSHAATMALIAAEIETNADVLSAVVSAARDITIIGLNGIAISASAVTTGGSSQGAWTQVQSDPGVFRGIAIHRHTEKNILTGVAQYEDEQSVDIMRRGLVWMPYVAAATPSEDDTLYINLAVSGEEGKATDISTNNIATGGVIRKVDTVNKLLQGEINLP